MLDPETKNYIDKQIATVVSKINNEQNAAKAINKVYIDKVVAQESKKLYVRIKHE